MREFTVGPNDAGQRLDRWLAKTLPLLPAPLAQKYIRHQAGQAQRQGGQAGHPFGQVGTCSSFTSTTSFSTPPPRKTPSCRCSSPSWTSSMRMRHLLLVNKRPGLVVHPDETERVNTLITHIQAYLYQKKEWNPYQEHAFAPALCNRIDRNTGGIVIAAKNAETLRIMNQKIRDREVEKSYLCLILGSISRRRGQAGGVPSRKMRSKSRSPSTKNRCPGAAPPSPSTAPWPGETGLSLVACRPGHRPHPPDPGPVCRRRPPPFGGRQSMAGPRTTSGMAAPPARRCAPISSPSASPQTPAASNPSTAAPGRWTGWTSWRSTSLAWP